MRARHAAMAGWGALVLATALAPSARALDEPVDRRITYQGQVEGRTGAAQIVFRIFDDTGTVVWGPETHDVVLDADGRFVTLIGSTGLDVCNRVGPDLFCTGPSAGADGVADLDQIAAEDLELEVTVDGVTLSPRQKLVPSFQAAKAASVEDQAVALAGLASDVLRSLVPTGAVLPFAGPSTAVPAGWLLCDGQQLDQSTHPDLFAVLGTAHGGSGSLFQVPDLRGLFLRGVDGGAGRDPDRNTRLAPAAGGNAGDAVGSLQDHQFQTHSHSIGVHSHSIGSDSHSHAVLGNTGAQLRLNDDGQNSGSISVDSSNIFGNVGDIRTNTDTHTHSITSGSGGAVGGPNSGAFGSETRSKNAYVNFIIRCGPADAC